MGRLDGRVAFVTGAGRGIGAATALRMAEEGARVALAVIDEEGCKQMATELEHVGSEGQAAIDQTVSYFGRLDILVNNAGVLRDNLLFKMTDDDWDTVMNVHLKGAFLCSRAAQAQMVKQNYGRIVSLSSTSALGNRGQSNYSTAKAEMTRATARRMGLDPQAQIEAGAKMIPVGRVGQPRDVANVITFLASEEAGFVSGQIIYVAGGPRG